MADADYMVHITQCELEKFIGQDTPCICKPIQRMIGENRPQTHASSMNDSFMAQTAQTSVTVDDFDLLPDDDIAENWKE
jgi:hypothetical protein